MVLTADRAPKEIPSLADRLTSRIESGLVVDMGQPDSATRLGILRRGRGRRGSEDTRRRSWSSWPRCARTTSASWKGA